MLVLSRVYAALDTAGEAHNPQKALGVVLIIRASGLHAGDVRVV
jgi:hypothetical protein